MPKFYHGEAFGFVYMARAIGWRRIFPFSLLPYLTGDIIQMSLSLKPLFEGQEWQEGILQIDPPDLYRGEPQIVVSDSVLVFGEWPRELSGPPKYQFPIDKWWQRTLSLKSGVRFGQPGNFQCSLVLQNVDGDKVEQTAPIQIADIEVVSRGPFLSNLFLWGLTTILATTAIILNIVR